MKRNGISGPALAFLVVALFVVASAAVVATQVGGATKTSSTATTGGSKTVTIGSIQGLQLTLGLNSTVLLSGQTLQVAVDEFNTLSTVNNVSASRQWPAQVSLGSCTNLNFKPFGIAVYSGHVDAQNLSQATPLQIFPIVPCPMLMRLITGYDFQPSSAQAVILPSVGAAPSSMAANINVSSTYSGQPKPLPPGPYTVLAADEWGAMAFLYFTVV
jgi:hypothetical protein